MLKVTGKAQQKLQDLIQSKATEENGCIRLRQDENKFKMTLDAKSDADTAITGDNGKEILLLDPETVKNVEGQVFDYIETQEQSGFAVTPMAPGDAEK
ncbi:MAG: hypothetical protein GF398_02755 [Chitinivibrionales bacterium]|nr:hypothetical protein [Chitinivibrionales bacterium]